MGSKPYREEFPVNLGDQTFVATQYSVAEFVALEKWLKSRPIALAGKSGVGQAHMQAAMAGAQAEAAKIGLGTPEGQALWLSIEGVTYSVFLGLRQKHPDITFDALLELVAMNDLPALSDVVTRLVNMPAPAPNPTVPATQAGT